MKMHVVLPVVIAALLTSCATAPPLKTASGRPEVTIRGRSTAQVRSAVVNHMVDRGYAPVQSDGNQLMFQKEDSAGDALLMGLITNNPQSSTRVRVTLIENGPDIRVIGGLAAVGATNFGGEHVIELSGKGYQQMQMALETIKARLEQ